MTDAELDALVFHYSQKDKCPCCLGPLRVEDTKEQCRLCCWRRPLRRAETVPGDHDPRQDVLAVLVELQKARGLLKAAAVRQAETERLRGLALNLLELVRHEDIFAGEQGQQDYERRRRDIEWADLSGAAADVRHAEAVQMMEGGNGD